MHQNLDQFLESNGEGLELQEKPATGEKEAGSDKDKKKGEFTFKIDDDEDGGQVISVEEAKEEFHDSDDEEKVLSEQETIIAEQIKIEEEAAKVEDKTV